MPEGAKIRRHGGRAEKIALHAADTCVAQPVRLPLSLDSFSHDIHVHFLRDSDCRPGHSLPVRRSVDMFDQTPVDLGNLEPSILQVPDVLKSFMEEMRNYGIVFALDDFGAGVTSLRLLREMRFEIAKIDGSLVKNVDTSPDGQAIARAAIAVAQDMDMYVVAEAVETKGEANWLRDAGVGCMQGYFFGPPTVTPDFRAFRHGRPSLATKPA